MLRCFASVRLGYRQWAPSPKPGRSSNTGPGSRRNSLASLTAPGASGATQTRNELGCSGLPCKGTGGAIRGTRRGLGALRPAAFVKEGAALSSQAAAYARLAREARASQQLRPRTYARGSAARRRRTSGQRASTLASGGDGYLTTLRVAPSSIHGGSRVIASGLRLCGRPRTPRLAIREMELSRGQ